MSVFRVEKNKGYTVMSNHHLRNHALSLKAKGLLSQMLSLPEDWDYTLQGLAQINKESIDAIREAVRELERAGYIKRSRERDERGCLRGTVYTIYEQPHAEPTPEEPTQEKPALDTLICPYASYNVCFILNGIKCIGRNIEYNTVLVTFCKYIFVILPEHANLAPCIRKTNCTPRTVVSEILKSVNMINTVNKKNIFVFSNAMINGSLKDLLIMIARASIVYIGTS